MSNVPDLDDEDEILAANVEKIQETLHYDELAATIHHYNSLLLLDQAIFAIERPRSRLAQEYQALAKRIRRGNLQDREGALELLEDVGKRLRVRRPLPADLETQIQEIIDLHPKEGEILRQLARLRRRQRKWHDALALLNQAISVGVADSDALLARAELRLMAKDQSGALLDVRQIFQLPEAPAFDLQAAVRLLIELNGPAEILIGSPAMTALSNLELVAVSEELQSRPETLFVAERLIESKLIPDSSGYTLVRNQLTICLIGQGKFAQAKTLLLEKGSEPTSFDIYDSFNYAMAEWADSRHVRADLFSAVVSWHLKAASPTGTNYHQCVAIAFWAIGDLDNAFKESKRAYDSIARIQGGAFSCWSYLHVEPGRFFRDIADMDRMFNGQPVIPAFMVRAGVHDLVDPFRPSLPTGTEPSAS